MSDVKAFPKNADFKIEPREPFTSTIEHGASIMCESDNALTQRLKQLDSLKAFKLTRDPRNSFSINDGVRLDSAEPGFKLPSEDKVEVNPHQENQAGKVIPARSLEQITARMDRWISHSLHHLQNNRPVWMNDSDCAFQIKKLHDFKNDVHEFMSTAHTRGLLPKDVDMTIRQIDRLMGASEGAQVSEFWRYRLAEQIISHAAHPTSIEQGRHNTCTVAAIESREFARNPGDASRVIVDVALTGKYLTAEKFASPDETMTPLEIEVHAEPDTESQISVACGQRTFASQIFQVVAVNIAYGLDNRLNGSHKVYEQQPPNRSEADDTGERIVDARTHEILLPELHSPNLSEDKLSVIIDAMTGTAHGADLVLVHESLRSHGGRSHTTGFESKEEFANALTRLKEQHKFPVILKVNCMCEPFFTEAGLNKTIDLHAAHVVSIKDYDSVRGLVEVDNEWDDSFDHGKKNPIKIDELYIATQSNEDVEKTLAKMVAEDKRCGRFDPRTHLQLARFQQLRMLEEQTLRTLDVSCKADAVLRFQ